MGKLQLCLLCTFIATQLALGETATVAQSKPVGISKFLSDTQTAFTHQDMRKHWIITGVSTLAALNIDQKVMPQREKLMSAGLANVGDQWGGFWAAVTILPGIMLADQLRSEGPDQKRRNLNYAFSSAVAIGLTTQIIKMTVRRERPNIGRAKVSFPSGHTSAAFGFAEVMRNLYGIGPGLVFYSLAVVTGVSRVHDNNHYPSDVIAGAGLGIGLARGFYIAQRPTQTDHGFIFQKNNMLNISWVF